MHKNLIGGEWVAGSKSQPNINPSDTRDVIGEYSQAKEGLHKSADLMLCKM